MGINNWFGMWFGEKGAVFCGIGKKYADGQGSNQRD
jgi:hypothetical protein